MLFGGKRAVLTTGEASERAEAEWKVEVRVPLDPGGCSRTVSSGKVIGCSGCGELSGGRAECSAADSSSGCGDRQAGTTKKRATDQCLSRDSLSVLGEGGYKATW